MAPKPIVAPDVTIPDGDAGKGAKLFKAKCSRCHTIDAGGASKTGPNLNSLFGKKSADDPNYNGYSDANRNAGIVWSPEHLWGFVTNPKTYMVGTKMVFAGMKKDKEKADLISYVKSLCD